MNWPWSDPVLLREQLKAAEARALAAEAALALERRDNRQQERHWASMFLRREKSLPLPPTAAEKAEAAEAKENQGPPPLTDVEIAMMVANRLDAAAVGIPSEQADGDWMKKRHTFTPEF